MLIGLDQKLIEGLLQTFVYSLEESLISWKSKKQNVVSRSNAESEYRAMSQSTCEIMWIHNLLTEIALKHHTPTKFWCGDQVALHIASISGVS